jgi:hypothetical protein
MKANQNTLTNMVTATLVPTDFMATGLTLPRSEYDSANITSWLIARAETDDAVSIIVL